MTTQETLGRLDAALADLALVVERIEPSQLHLPTPCTQYDVQQLLTHVVGWLENFAAGFASEDGRCPRPDVDVDTEPVPLEDAPARIRQAAALLRESATPDAVGRPLVISGQGGLPGEMALGMMLAEYQVHGWDLARATDQAWAAAPDAATESREFLGGMVQPEHRGPDGMFDAEVPVADDADPLDRLLGFTGRAPGWSRP